MKINLRVVIKSYLLIVLAYIIGSYIAQRPLNKIVIVSAELCLMYIVLTAEVYTNQERIKNKRKIRDSNGNYIEDPMFRKIYYSFLAQYSEKLEKLRKRIVKYKIISYILFLCFIHLFSFYTFKNIILNSIIIILVGYTYIVVRTNTDKDWKKYKIIYKKEIISNFINQINPNLEYDEYGLNNKIEEEYRASGLENKKFSIMNSDDIISGQISKDTYIDLANICVKDIRKDEFGKNQEYYVFEGLFSASKCLVDTKGFIKIISQTGDIGVRDRSIKVELDSEAFEKIYNVFSPDKIFAMRILTPEVMEMLTEFGKYEFYIDISINNNMIYTRLKFNNMFEPKLLSHTVDRDILYSYYCVIKFVAMLTEKINKSLESFVS